MDAVRTPTINSLDTRPEELLVLRSIDQVGGLKTIRESSYQKMLVKKAVRTRSDRNLE